VGAAAKTGRMERFSLGMHFKPLFTLISSFFCRQPQIPKLPTRFI
jgi:hypothetical protein